MRGRAFIGFGIALFALGANAGDVDENVPEPWFKNGQPPAKDQCLAGVDTALEQQGTQNLTLRCEASAAGFVGVMQEFSAENYLGKRVRFSASVKSENIAEGWGGLWMRVDDHDRRSSAFDNMQDRPIEGSTEWTQHAVVLDVSQDGEGIFFGVLLTGSGQIWIKDLQFDSVGDDVPTTGPRKPTKPGNLELAR